MNTGTSRVCTSPTTCSLARWPRSRSPFWDAKLARSSRPACRSGKPPFAQWVFARLLLASTVIYRLDSPRYSIFIILYNHTLIQPHPLIQSNPVFLWNSQEWILPPASQLYQLSTPAAPVQVQRSSSSSSCLLHPSPHRSFEDGCIWKWEIWAVKWQFKNVMTTGSGGTHVELVVECEKEER